MIVIAEVLCCIQFLLDSVMLVSPRLFSKIRLIADKVFGKYLLTTNVVTSGILMGVGDAVEQVIELEMNKHPTGKFDWRRISK